MSTSPACPERTTPAKCRACNRPMDSPLFCANCRTLHPADECQHFELFGLPPAYDVDLAELRRRYLRCSRAVHPDRHGGTAADAAALSLRGSARLNEAYSVLMDPLMRAEYLLELVGGNSSAQDKTVPREVLTRTLQFREQIEEARAAGDQATLAESQQQVRQLYEEALGGIAELARRLPGSEEVRQQLRQRLNAGKYYQKLLDQL